MCGADITRSFPSRGAAMAVHRSTHAGCAGVEQAACAAGYRYRKGDVCHKEVECKAFSYECILCQPGEECDTNYDTETEEGEDYDCKQNLWSGCYFLWPFAWIFFYLTVRQVSKMIEEGNQSEAKVVWTKRKWYWAVWKSTSAIRHRVDGVQVDATSQHERAVKFDFHTGGRVASSWLASSFIRSRSCGWACMVGTCFSRIAFSPVCSSPWPAATTGTGWSGSRSR